MSNPVVGNIIQSFDFVGNVDNYMIGKVVNIECDIIRCETLRHVIDGIDVSVTQLEFLTPMQGSCILDDKFERVIVLG